MELKNIALQWVPTTTFKLTNGCSSGEAVSCLLRALIKAFFKPIKHTKKRLSVDYFDYYYRD
jgi:hypothetical protein